MTAARPWPESVRVIGLTGGIASGKSTVSKMLRELGAPIIDADVLAREVVAPGSSGLEEVGRRFPGVVREDGTLDRAALGERVFASETERKALEAILHPRIQQLSVEKARALAASGARVIVYEAPLIFENRIDERLDGTILVVAPPELQFERLVARDGLSPERARARIRAQMPLAEKRACATWVIDNAGPLAETRDQVEALWAHLLRAPG